MKDVQRMAHHVSDEFVEKIINFYYLLASGLGIEGLLSFKDGILKSMFFMASSTLPIVFANSLSKMNFTSKNTIELAKSYHLFLKEYVKLQKTFSFFSKTKFIYLIKKTVAFSNIFKLSFKNVISFFPIFLVDCL